MNHRLERLQPYPFERLNQLLADVDAPAQYDFIPLSLGEPKHAAPDFIVDQMSQKDFIRDGFGAYPPTKGRPELREAIADFLHRRYHLTIRPDPDTQILPVNGTREALFAFAQVAIDPDIYPDKASVTLLPNPFYQIYEGAALLAGSQPVYVPCTEQTGHNPDFSDIDEKTWESCSLLYICSPGNPTGAVMGVEEMQQLIRLSDQYDFVIASDECYSEIYADEDKPPPGLLQAASMMGRSDYRNCIVFNSLSKRSNLPGLRSGLVCGDATWIAKFLLYRTYHGSAMPIHSQLISAAAWQDEAHVIANRVLYRQKYDAVLDILKNTWPMEKPAASFYLWPTTPVDDVTFTRKLLAAVNIKVIPGQYLARDTDSGNPGRNRVRLALVATLDECTGAAERLKQFMQAEQYR
jgi:N-succinyldiaminopimelate aminotransferase